MTIGGQDPAVLLKQRLSPESLRITRMASEIVGNLGQSLYLAGGAVRDLLLGRDTLDIDLVTEGDVVAPATTLAEKLRGKALVHRRFGTAKVRWDGSSADLAMARAETYDRPGALPRVRPGSIEEDLHRRDFTINSMAINLDNAHFGKMIDPFGGREDLKRGLIRILHEMSFVDDPTRMFRAVRYEQRFDFQLETETEQLLRSNAAGLRLVSGDRIRHELELITKEENPEKALQRADDLGLLKEVHPGLKADEWLGRRYRQARAMLGTPAMGLYFGLLSYWLTEEETEDLVGRLKMPRSVAVIVRDCARLRGELPAMEAEELAPSSICRMLDGYSPAAIMTCAVATDSDRIAERLQVYVTRWRHVRTSLDGIALKNLGIPPGPKVGEMLNRLREVKLDGLVRTREDEVRMLKGWGYG